jgi:hypothetical protein
MIVRRVEGDMGFFSVIKQWGFVVQDNEIFFFFFFFFFFLLFGIAPKSNKKV